jgi:hypothetical protein
MGKSLCKSTFSTVFSFAAVVFIAAALTGCNVTVPDVVGMERNAAQSAIEAAGLVLGTVEEAHDPVVPIDHVISQNPPADTTVPRDSAVELVVSIGEGEGEGEGEGCYPIAAYDFDGNLSDVSGNGLDFIAQSTSFVDNGLYLNGVYGGYEAGTPLLSRLNYERFSLSLDFELDSDAPRLPQTPIVVGGHSYRWFAVFLDEDRQVGFYLNNHVLVHVSSQRVDSGTRYHLEVCMDLPERSFKVYLNGTCIIDYVLPEGTVLEVVQAGVEYDKLITCIDYSNGTAFYGLLDNLSIYSDCGCEGEGEGEGDHARVAASRHPARHDV